MLSGGSSSMLLAEYTIFYLWETFVAAAPLQ